MFEAFLNKLGFGKKEDGLVGAPIKGEAVALSEVNDPAFSKGLLGVGLAIKPEKGRVVSPVNGKVSVFLESMHAVSVVSDGGIQLLIHVGLDTVNLKGRYFKGYVKAGDRVRAGDLLLEFEMDRIKAEGYDVISPVVVCNATDFSEVLTFEGKHVEELDKVMQVNK